MHNLQIESLVLGSMAENCYLAKNRETGAALILDPGDMSQHIFDRISQIEAKPEAILLTHGHFDHIGAADQLRERYRIPILALDMEREVLENADLNLTRWYGDGYTLIADSWLRDGEELSIAGFSLQVMHTPGHTIGSSCYYLPDEEVLFSGDTLFNGSVGRTDFPTGSEQMLLQSVREKLFTLPDQTEVFPGHEGSTTILYEKRFNPCV